MPVPKIVTLMSCNTCVYVSFARCNFTVAGFLGGLISLIVTKFVFLYLDIISEVELPIHKFFLFVFSFVYKFCVW